MVNINIVTQVQLTYLYSNINMEKVFDFVGGNVNFPPRACLPSTKGTGCEFYNIRNEYCI